jgi:hypothetical protein
MYSPLRRRYADAFLPYQKEILSKLFACKPNEITEATFKADTEEATDLILPNKRTIGVRVRNQCQKSRYYGQFTLRTIEIPKIASGHMRYLLYGFDSGDGKTLDSWWLLDMDAVRAAYADGLSCTRYEEVEAGRDGNFYAFHIGGFLSYPPLVAATSERELGNNDDCGNCASRSAARASLANTRRLWGELEALQLDRKAV